MIKAIMPYVARALSSDTLLISKRRIRTLKRKAFSSPSSVDVFLKADDPYSYLLIQALRDFESRFAITLKFHVFQDLDLEMYPRLDMWEKYARHDANHLAQIYNFEFPSQAAPEEIETIHQLACKLVAMEHEDNFLDKAQQLLHDFWFNKASTTNTPSNSEDPCKPENKNKLTQNKNLLAKKGHYLGAMLYFEGEWYWGVDRLDHLEQRLIDSKLAHHEEESVRFNLTYRDFCMGTTQSKPTNPEPFVLYWSARSPYSYLGLEKAIRLSRHYQIPLDIKPVLPMMMRGMDVPSTKKMYIFLDTKREASKQSIPYGFVADPLGEAVERCYALVELAKSKNKLEDFLLSFARAVNSQGIRAETEKGLETIVTRCGLDWAEAKLLLKDRSWEQWAHDNLNEMFEMGCWGVPSIRYGDTHFWGQDRFGLVENLIQRNGK